VNLVQFPGKLSDRATSIIWRSANSSGVAQIDGDNRKTTRWLWAVSEKEIPTYTSARGRSSRREEISPGPPSSICADYSSQTFIADNFEISEAR